MRTTLARGMMFLGLVITGMALFFGLAGEGRPLSRALGGPVRAELTLLAVGAAVFFAGSALRGGRR
jgi:hypothetical protein